ncbi:MAG: tetratricopeptide repeat protein, partial [Desulfovibrionaceae bacterium]
MTHDALLRANQAIAANDFQQAADLLREFGDDPEALLLRGRALRELSHWTESGQAYAKAVELGAPEQQAKAHTGWGFALLSQGQADQARQAFGKALALDADAVDARRGLGMCWLKAGRLGEAEAEIEACLAQAPDDPGALAAQGLLRMRQGQAGEAERLLQRAVEIDPHSCLGWANLGFVHRQAGRADQAVDALERAAKLRPHNALTRNSLALALR